MAKRRRLEGPIAGPAEMRESTPRAASAPPIASVAGQSATIAAAESVMAAMTAAREGGLLAEAVPVDAITTDHLVRDRVMVEDEDMAALRVSLAEHGQRTPIELVATGPGTYGLISGWRRLAAIRALGAETNDPRYQTVLAVLRAPRDAGAAYVAMVEENEIRVGLSHYERGRIAAMAARQGAFATPQAAVDVLFASGSKAKRSKIRAFLALHEALGDVLRFPTHLNERIGLKLAQAVRDGQGAALRAALADDPAQTPEAEATRLLAAVSHAKPAKHARAREELAPGISVEQRKDMLILKGPGVTDDLLARLRTVLTG